MVEVCPVCEGVQFEPWDRGQSLDLRRCQQCSLVFLETAQRPEDYFEQVEAEFFGDGYLRRRGLFSGRFFICKARRRMRMLRRFRSSGRLLEIGSGTGELLHVARQMGYGVVGLDYSESLVRYVSEKYGVPVYVGDSESVQFPHKFDAVIMSHVLEHTIDPVATLHSIHRLLEPGGLLYLAVPNLDCWESRFRGWTSYEPYHLWYFDGVNLSRLLERSGYRVVDIRTWEPYPSWLNTAVRTIVPRRHAQARALVHKDGSWRVRYLFLMTIGVLNAARLASGCLLTPLRLMQERLKKGEELVCVAASTADR